MALPIRVWVVFTAFDVFSIGLVGNQIRSIIGGEEARRSKPWVLACHVFVSLVWVHGCTALVVLRNKSVGRVTGGYRIEAWIDVVVVWGVL